MHNKPVEKIQRKGITTMKRQLDLTVVLLLTILMLLFTACGGGKPGTDTPDEGKNYDVTEDTEEAGMTAEPGVYAVLEQLDNSIEVSPIPGGITDSTILPTFKCTFGDMTTGAQNALEEGRVFPKEFFRDLTACMLISEEQMAGKDHDAIMYALCSLAAMANEFWSLDPTLKNVVYEFTDDGQAAKSIYNVHFGAADKDGQIVYDNQNGKWYLDNAEYSGSLDSDQTLAIWWTIFDIADGNDQ